MFASGCLFFFLSLSVILFQTADSCPHTDTRIYAYTISTRCTFGCCILSSTKYFCTNCNCRGHPHFSLTLTFPSSLLSFVLHLCLRPTFVSSSRLVKPPLTLPFIFIYLPPSPPSSFRSAAVRVVFLAFFSSFVFILFSVVHRAFVFFVLKVPFSLFLVEIQKCKYTQSNFV